MESGRGCEWMIRGTSVMREVGEGLYEVVTPRGKPGVSVLRAVCRMRNKVVCVVQTQSQVREAERPGLAVWVSGDLIRAR